MNFLKVTVQCAETESQEIMIAQLSESGFEGFEQLDEVLIGYVKEDHFTISSLGDIIGGEVFEVEAVPDRNWNEQWEQNFQPVVIEGLCGIRAHFHEPIVGVAHEIVITPKMSFGTGHHATTRLMVVLMSEINFAGMRVLDFGTGTGILAIYAEMKGADSVVATDIDEWSVENAQENIVRNNCTKITILKSDGFPAVESGYDCILANINRHVLLEHMPALFGAIIVNGMVIMSGLLETDKELITAAVEEAGFIVKYTIGLNNWIALLLEKPTSEGVKIV